MTVLDDLRTAANNLNTTVDGAVAKLAQAPGTGTPDSDLVPIVQQLTDMNTKLNTAVNPAPPPNPVS